MVLLYDRASLIKEGNNKILVTTASDTHKTKNKNKRGWRDFSLD